MLPSPIPEANIELLSPQFGSTDCFFSIESGFPFYTTAWMPSREDMEALNAGLPLLVKICAHAQPAVVVFTRDADGNDNYQY